MSDTGLKFSARFLFPFLKIGAMFALGQSSGNVPVFNDWLNMSVRTGASVVTVSMRM